MDINSYILQKQKLLAQKLRNQTLCQQQAQSAQAHEIAKAQKLAQQAQQHAQQQEQELEIAKAQKLAQQAQQAQQAQAQSQEIAKAQKLAQQAQAQSQEIAKAQKLAQQAQELEIAKAQKLAQQAQELEIAKAQAQAQEIAKAQKLAQTHEIANAQQNVHKLELAKAQKHAEEIAKAQQIAKALEIAKVQQAQKLAQQPPPPPPQQPPRPPHPQAHRQTPPQPPDISKNQELEEAQKQEIAKAQEIINSCKTHSTLILRENDNVLIKTRQIDIIRTQLEQKRKQDAHQAQLDQLAKIAQFSQQRAQSEQLQRLLQQKTAKHVPLPPQLPVVKKYIKKKDRVPLEKKEMRLTVLDDLSLEDFKNFVKKWIEFDGYVKKVQQILKDKKRQRDKLSEIITKFMNKYNIEDINTKEGRIRCKKTYVTKTLTQKEMKEKIINLMPEKKDLVKQLYDERPKQEKVSLRRLKIT
jgi:hypothetical protein